MGKKQKTAAEIKSQISALKGELREAEQAEREKIGREMQRLTGKTTWEEIKAFLDVKRAKLDSV